MYRTCWNLSSCHVPGPPNGGKSTGKVAATLDAGSAQNTRGTAAHGDEVSEPAHNTSFKVLGLSPEDQEEHLVPLGLRDLTTSLSIPRSLPRRGDFKANFFLIFRNVKNYLGCQ